MSHKYTGIEAFPLFLPSGQRPFCFGYCLSEKRLNRIRFQVSLHRDADLGVRLDVFT